MRPMILATALALSATHAAAHDSTGPHGGQATDAGPLHVEVLTTADQVHVFLADAAGKPVAATGYKGLAILLVAGKVARIALQPEGSERLVGTAPAPAPAPIKGAIQITAPDGTTMQASFK